jgi:hypothetical protein
MRGWRVGVLGGLGLLGVAHAAVPGEVAHQGRLTTASGTALAGSSAVTFTVYDAATSGSALWTETHSAVAFDDGYYAVQLGSVTALPSSVFAGGPRWLGVSVGSGPELAPRTAILAVPVATTALGVELASSPPVACNHPSHRGRLYYDTDDDAFLGCDGSAWGGLGGAAAPATSTRYGDGADGDVVVSAAKNLSTQPVATARVAITKADSEAFAVAILGSTTITVSGTGTGGTASSSLSTTYLPGDELLVVEMQGAPGSVDNVGTSATCVVSSVSGATVTCGAALTGTFSSAGSRPIQVLRVPNYDDLNVTSAGSLTVNAWDGAKGGVLAVRVSGVATIDGLVDLSQKGFRGGVVGTGAAENIAGRPAAGGAGGGGGAGHATAYNGAGGVPGGGAASGANGGSGGIYNSRRAGGGGGNDSGSGGLAGASSGIGNTASPPSNGTAGTGGGAAAGYDAGAGGGGAIPLAAGGFSAPANLSKIMLGGGGAHGGGGGGAGSSDGGPGGGGGGGGHADGNGGAGATVSCTAPAGGSGLAGQAGGGILWIAARTLGVGATATLRSGGGSGGNGGAGGSACNVGASGGSGGGGGWGGDGASGGSILLQGDVVAFGTNKVTAAAGAGGTGGSGGSPACSSRCGASGGTGGPGLAGTDGAIRVEYTTSVTGSSSTPAASIAQVAP